MPDNSQKLELIRAIRQSGYPGSATEVFQAYDQGQDLVGQWVQQQQQQQEMQQQQSPQGPQGMGPGGPPPPPPPPNRRPDGRVSQPNVNQSIDNNQGHLVQSQTPSSVGIQDLPTGPAQGQMIQARKGGIRQSKSYVKKYNHGGLHLGQNSFSGIGGSNLGISKYTIGLGSKTNTSVMDRFWADQPSVFDEGFKLGNFNQQEYELALKAQELQNQNFQTRIDKLPFSGKGETAFGEAYDYYPKGEDFTWKGNKFKSERSSDAYRRIKTEGWKGPIPQGIVDAYNSGTTKDPITGYSSGFKGVDPNQFRVGSTEWQYLVGNPKYSETQNKKLLDQFQTYAGTDENQPQNMEIIKQGIESGLWTQLDVDNLTSGRNVGGMAGMKGNPDNIPLNTADLLSQLKGGGYNLDGSSLINTTQPSINPLSSTTEDDDDYFDLLDDDYTLNNYDDTYIPPADNLAPGLPNTSSAGGSVLNSNIVYDKTQGGTKTQLPNGDWIDMPVQQTFNPTTKSAIERGKKETAQWEMKQNMAKNPYYQSYANLGHARPTTDPDALWGRYNAQNINVGAMGAATIPAAAPSLVAPTTTALTWGSTGYGVNQMLNPYSGGGASAANFINNPSWSTAGSLGGDALWTLPGLNVLKGSKWLKGVKGGAIQDVKQLGTSLTSKPSVYNPNAVSQGWGQGLYTKGVDRINKWTGGNLQLNPSVVSKLGNVDKFGSKIWQGQNMFTRSRLGEANKIGQSIKSIGDPQKYFIPSSTKLGTLLKTNKAGTGYNWLGRQGSRVSDLGKLGYYGGKFTGSLSAAGHSLDYGSGVLTGKYDLDAKSFGKFLDKTTDAYASNLSYGKDLSKVGMKGLQGDWSGAGSEALSLLKFTKPISYSAKLYEKYFGE